MDGGGATEGTRRHVDRVAGTIVALLVAGLVALAAVVGSPTPVAAERPEDVRDGVVPPGIYLAPETDPARVDVAALSAEVERARGNGIDLIVVLAQDPRPNPESFALRVRQLGVGDPIVVFGPDGQIGVSSDAVPTTDLGLAQDAARAEDGIEAAVAAFTGALLDGPDDSVPDVVPTLLRLAVAAAAVLVLSALAERSLRRRRRRRRSAARPATRAAPRPAPGDAGR